MGNWRGVATVQGQAGADHLPTRSYSTTWVADAHGIETPNQRLPVIGDLKPTLGISISTPLPAFPARLAAGRCIQSVQIAPSDVAGS